MSSILEHVHWHVDVHTNVTMTALTGRIINSSGKVETVTLAATTCLNNNLNCVDSNKNMKKLMQSQLKPSVLLLVTCLSNCIKTPVKEKNVNMCIISQWQCLWFDSWNLWCQWGWHASSWINFSVATAMCAHTCTHVTKQLQELAQVHCQD